VLPARAKPSVFRRQENGVVREVEPDLIDREIRKLDVLCVNDVAIAVIADERCGSVFIDLQPPHLEFLARHSLLIKLSDGDRIQKPVGSAPVSNVFRAVCEEDLGVDSVPVPVFGTGELPEMKFVELFGVRHDVTLSFE
jgi:hypothetical protein